MDRQERLERARAEIAYWNMNIQAFSSWAKAFRQRVDIGTIKQLIKDGGWG